MTVRRQERASRHLIRWHMHNERTGRYWTVYRVYTFTGASEAKHFAEHALDMSRSDPRPAAQTNRLVHYEIEPYRGQK